MQSTSHHAEYVRAYSDEEAPLREHEITQDRTDLEEAAVVGKVIGGSGDSSTSMSTAGCQVRKGERRGGVGRGMD